MLAAVVAADGVQYPSAAKHFSVRDNAVAYFQRVSSAAGTGTATHLQRTCVRRYTGAGHVIDNDSVQMTRFPGGYLSRGVNAFYYLTDYQGNNIAVVDAAGSIIQLTDYYPYGEPWRYPDGQPYLYSDKELTRADGRHAYTFPARTYLPYLARFSIPDQSDSDYCSISNYSAFGCNPNLYIDPSGNDLVLNGTNDSQLTVITGLIDCQFDVSSFIDWGGQFDIEGDDILSTALDLVGIIDPSGIADGLNALLQFGNGNYWDAACSAISFIPFGDIVKVGSIGKKVNQLRKQLAINVKAGKRAEQIVQNRLVRQYSGDKRYSVLRQVTGVFSDGSRVRFDHVVVDNIECKPILIVETKSGNARLSQQQRRFFNNGESVTFVGNNKGNINSKSYNKTTVDTSIERIK